MLLQFSAQWWSFESASLPSDRETLDVKMGTGLGAGVVEDHVEVI
jgi:hypothetical protein